MFKIDSIAFQERAINDLFDKTKSSIDKENQKILFTAPVGSGKTIVAGLYMDKFLNFSKSKNDKIAFVWASTSKGNLLKQSMNSVKDILSYGNVRELTDILSNREIAPYDVVFLNWESIRSEENIARRGGEKPDLESIIENSDVKIILLIDEAHESVGAKKTDEAIDIINPHLTVHITATPKEEKGNYDALVEIDIEDVIEEGIIKKGVFINQDLDNNNKSEILTKAISKRTKIEEELEKYERTIKRKPLVLIQIANDSQRLAGDSGDDVDNATEIKEMLKDKGIPNEKIGIWLAEKENCQNIDEDIKNSDIEYLIFKQAIATGWDCPRAHILVRFRETKSAIFDIQTIGRILRTVERKHYNNDLIDNAYIYTEYDDLEYKIDANPQVESKIYNKENWAELKKEFRDKYRVEIPMEKINRSYNCSVEGSHIGKQVLEKLKENLNAYTMDKASFKKRMLVGKAETINIGDEDKFLDKTYKFLNKSKEDIFSEFKNSIAGIYSKYNFERVIVEALKDHPDCENIHDIRCLYVYNKHQINGMIEECIANYEKSISDNAVDKIDYKTPKDVYYKKLEKDTEKYAYDKQPVLDVDITKSSFEDNFGKWLDGEEDVKSNIKWWYKNGVHGENFSIAYTYSEKNEKFHSLYYPDFIIVTKDKRLIIIDIKAANNEKDYPYVKEKYEAGKKYEKSIDLSKNENYDEIFMSVVKFIEDEPYVCIGDKYNENVYDPNSWIKFSEIL